MPRLTTGLHLLVVLCCLPAAQRAMAADPASGWSAVVLPAVRQQVLQSARTGQRYRVFLSIPDAPPPPAGYPVLYLLDGNAAFPLAALLARTAASRRQITGYAPLLVVGIGYPGEADYHLAARTLDYTVGATRPEVAATEGGADCFLDFIDTELRPLLEASYPLDAQRQALFGHSFGGLLVLHALLSRPAMFSAYLASSPSIWWNDKSVLRGFAGRTAGAAPPAVVQLSVGAREDDLPQGNYPPDVLAARATRAMIPEARGFAARLRTLPGWDERVTYFEFDGEDHGTSWLPALSRGMQRFLSQP